VSDVADSMEKGGKKKKKRKKAQKKKRKTQVEKFQRQQPLENPNSP